MRIVIENYGVRKAFGDERAIEMIARAGFDATDYSFYWMPAGERVLDAPDYAQNARRLRRHADDCGLAIAQAHAPFDYKADDTAEKRKYDYEAIQKSIEFAALLGARQIVVHSIKPLPGEDFVKRNLEYYQGLEPFCKEFGIRIAVENLWSVKDGVIGGGRLSTPEELSAFLDNLNTDHFCACLDVGHSKIVGVEPGDFARKLGTPKLQALHIQDTDGRHDSHTLPYLGVQDWADLTSALAEVNYTGDFTLEIISFLRAFPAELLPSALKLACETGRHLIADVESARTRQA